MVSSGIRVGAFEYLSWGDITPVEKAGRVVAAKVRVYSGTNEEYFSFVTPEAYSALKEYIDFRAKSGETITQTSPVLRDLWFGEKGGKPQHFIARPRRLDPFGVKRLVENAIQASGLRKPLAKGQRRHEFQALHGFRKFFKSTCERTMKTLHVELLLGHNVGLNANYYRPTEEDLLNDYLKAVPELTILEEVSRVEPIAEERIMKLEEDNRKLKETSRKQQDTLKEVLKVLDAIKKEREQQLAG